MTGKGFKANGDLNGEWWSQAAALNVDTKKFIYTYRCERISRSEDFKGLCQFTMEYPSSTGRAMTMHGYSADFNGEPRKIESKEFRIEDSLEDMEICFKRAVEIFNSEQDGAGQPATAAEL